ncbi:uncharacterized protein LOC125670329 isoform X2 [Ostrea edulis]|uniref:uncharacterized protein LOC125670329 isoform X2 n=1 Tax=Ostrea edulis TaxID=37623 RepID=UPI0024AEE322|nr:uncharacterized protein LOC125670329 isoform X2 [Ostrea edulis]
MKFPKLRMTRFYNFLVQDSDTESSANNYIDSSTTELFDGSRRKKRSRSIVIAVLVIIGLAVSLGVGLGVGLRKKTPDNSQEQSATAAQQNGTTKNPGGPTTSAPGISTATTPSTGSTTSMFSSTTPPEKPTTTDTGKAWIDEPCKPHDSTPNTCPWSTSPVLLVSLDGFRADYLTRNLTPTLKKLSQCGVHTPYMRSVYPTLTFPNHYSIVTGLYPESHGIVDNNMYDEKINDTFHIYTDAKSNPAWWGGEPLWITAQKQGKKSAAFFWVGSDVNISGQYPDIWKHYDGKVSYEERVDTVLDWLSMSNSDRPDFVMLYFDEPDHTGHDVGPDGPEVNEMLGKMDNIISRLMNGLYRKQIHNCVNLIILADHGMEKTSCNRRVFLNTYIDTKEYLVFDGTIGSLHTDFYTENKVVKRKKNPLSVEDVMGMLKCKSGHLQMFSKSDIPVRHHYTNNKRIGDIVMDVQAKWMVAKDKHTYCLEGNHGFDNLYKSMQALFLAHGPGFKQNYTSQPFENIELYNLMSDLMGISPAPNNGTPGALHDIMHNPSTLQTTPIVSYRDCPVSSVNTATPKISCSCNMSSPAVYPQSVDSNKSLPLGEIKQTKDLEACILHNTDYSTGFSHMYNMPVWTSYVLKDSQNISMKDNCIITDGRIPANNSFPCTTYENENVTYASLFNSGFKSDSMNNESSFSSNIAPMFRGFKSGIWTYLWRIVSDFARQRGDLAVTLGPAFDYNEDGLYEGITPQTQYVDVGSKKIPLPTHFYVILVRCTNLTLKSCPVEDLDILSLILPNIPSVPNCMPEEEYLRENVARIRDIELLTGLRFLNKYDERTSARLRTYLPSALWPTQNIAYKWSDLPCEDSSQSTCPGKIPLLLISLDGFRADYLKQRLTPVIQKMRDCGVHTPYMRSVYPTVTFPNHYTIATGLYPESHGIISNNMYDPEIGVFSLSSVTKLDPRWWGGEPLWITAKKQKKRTATYFWPGSDVNISGIYPDIWKMYSNKAGFPERVWEVIGWLTLAENEKPDFITLYFDQPDHAGHQGGPESEEVSDQLLDVDDMLSRLMDTLYHKGLHNCVNIVIIADHGMDDVSCSQVVKLPNYMSKDVIDDLTVFGGTFGRVQTKFHKKSKYKIFPNDQNNTRSVEEVVGDLMCQHPKMKVFTGETIPKRFHYYNNPRMGEILLDMYDQWLVTDTKYFYCSGGNHGWDNLYKTMHALFLAHGPGFKQKLQIDPFENIELYNMMSELLGISPAPNNGTRGSLHHILRNPPPLSAAPQEADQKDCPVSVNSNSMWVPVCGCVNNQNETVNNLMSEHFSSSPVWSSIGQPEGSGNLSLCVLNYTSMETGYNTDLQMPAWTNLVLSSRKISTSRNGTSCIVNDPRVPETSCEDFTEQSRNITIGLLYDTDAFHPGGRKSVHYSSNAVPMYEGFKSGIWNATWKLAYDYALKYNNVSITVGPAFDYNKDGLADQSFNESSHVRNGSSVVLPTHFYMMMIKCKNSSQTLPCDDNFDILSFILPHVDTVPNCMMEEEYWSDNVARVRDIELLTGLQFFSSYNTSTRARLTTFLPVNLWKSMTQKWIDTQCGSGTCNSQYQPLLLISLDGFRADYLMRNFTPYIRRLSQCGVHAPYMRSVYPTKTFPNHYSIVTGLYPESHGIVDNNMYDTDIKEKFSLSSPNASDPRWWGGEPIWNTAQKHMKKSATYFWPGSEHEIEGMRPDYYKEYDGNVPFLKRVDTVLSWIDLPADKRPDFITLYFDEPDHAGHSFGPDDIVKIGQAQTRVDEAVGRLMEGLFKRNMHDCTNIIIVADHGMADTDCDRLITFRDYLTSVNNVYIYEGPFSRIDPYHKYSNTGLRPVTHPYTVSGILANLTCKTPHFKAFDKNLLPVRHHYVNNKRIEPIVVDVEDKWLVTFRALQGYKKTYCKGGNHGYDNLYKSMQALFLAHGPVFKQNMATYAFENIELYNLMSDILNITSAPNNGTQGTLNHILRNPKRLTRTEGNKEDRNTTKVKASEFVTAVDNPNCRQMCSFLPEKMYTIGRFLALSSKITDMDVSDQLPFGVPSVQLQGVSSKILYQDQYITGYSDLLQRPLWIAYSLKKAQVSETVPDASSCVVPDMRVSSKLNSSQSCSTNGSLDSQYRWTSLISLVPSSLNQPELNSFSSVYVPMLNAFKNGIWRSLHNKIGKWSRSHDSVNVLTGPVYDLNHDGLPDLQFNQSMQIPSHFYVILSRCPSPNLSCQSPITLSFILPHIEDTNCLSVEDYLSDNEARVRDVELITGLEFFTELPVDSAIRTRTYLPSGLW